MFNIFNKFIYILLLVITTNESVMADNSIYQLSFVDIDGKTLNLQEFEGKPILACTKINWNSFYIHWNYFIR